MRLIFSVTLYSVLTCIKERDRGRASVWKKRGGGGRAQEEEEKKEEREVLCVSLEQSRGVARRGNGSVATQKMCIVRQKLRLSFDMNLKRRIFFSVGNS